MGKACVRVKSADDVPMDVMAESLRMMPVDRFIEVYEANFPAAGKKAAAKKVVAKKATAKKKVAKKKTQTATKKKATTKKR